MSIENYEPRDDSLAGRCIAYFRRLPDEELSAKDIALKFTVPVGTIHQLLKDAVEYERLARDGAIYSAGANLVDTPKASTPANVVERASAKSNWPKAPRPTPRKLAMFDIDALKVDVGVAMPPRNASGLSKWDPLFAKLTQAGQSIAFPVDHKDAVSAELYKRHKLAAARYRTARISTTEARIWRLA